MFQHGGPRQSLLRRYKKFSLDEPGANISGVITTYIKLCIYAINRTFDLIIYKKRNNSENSLLPQDRTEECISFFMPCAMPAKQPGKYGLPGHPYPPYGDIMDITPPYLSHGLCGQPLDKNRIEEVEGSSHARTTLPPLLDRYRFPGRQSNLVNKPAQSSG